MTRVQAFSMRSNFILEQKMKSMKFQAQSFRGLLQEELLRRCRDNPGYSLRSFATTLQVSPSSLSRMLRGEREISTEMKSRLGKRLGIPPHRLEELPTDASAKNKSPHLPGNNFKQLAADTFAVMSDWYHYAILELTNLKNFESTSQWVAKTLGITVSEVNVAMERLQRLGLLKVTKSGRWINSSGSHTNVSGDLSGSAHRTLQRQVLQLAMRALDEIPIERRDQSSMTMSLNEKRLPEAIEKITQFRRELCAFVEQDRSRDSVYQLSISLFPLTNILKDEELL